jgi:hypothetical protein
MTLIVDNLAALRRMNNKMEDGLIRYLATHHMYLREKVSPPSGEVKPEWVETKRNVAAIMTKPLGGKDLTNSSHNIAPAAYAAGARATHGLALVVNATHNGASPDHMSHMPNAPGDGSSLPSRLFRPEEIGTCPSKCRPGTTHR